MSKFSGADVPFLNLLYTDQLYLIPKNRNQPNQTLSSSEVQGQTGTNETAIHFNGTTSSTLLLVNYPNAEGIPAQDMTFLNQILKAVGLDFKTLAWLDTATLPENINWSNISAQSPSKFVITFGIGTKHLPGGAQEGSIYLIDDKKMLCASTLSEIAINASKKKFLWHGLKEIYGL